MSDLTPYKFSDAVATILTRPFPGELVLKDKKAAARPDGFVPSYIPWDQVTKRLDEAFGMAWSWEITQRSIEGGTWIVEGRLSVPLMTAEGREVSIVKSGIGACAIEVDANGRPVNIGDDLKTAVAEGMKRAAILLRVGIQLYERDNQKQDVVQQAAAQTQNNQSLPAQPFQVKAVRDLLARYNAYPENYSCQALKVAKLEDITQLVAAQLLSGQHPFIAWLNSQFPQVATPAPGLKATNA